MDKLDPKTDGASTDIVAENIDKLRELFPEAFTEGSDADGPRWKVDFDALKQCLGEYVEEERERYSFTWHGKSRARQIAQTPSQGTLRPCPEESVNWDTTKNLFIEGDNLEVLKLLQKSYHKQVKMIYIDPPYNTGGEFIYPDRFQDNLDTYLRYTGQIDDQGFKISANAESSGRYHTNWLNMMLPRLKLARSLLSDDGVIAISIDDVEVANLLKLCDEVFGEENRIANIMWQKRYVSNVTAKWISDMHDFIIIYAKNSDNVVANKWNRSDDQLASYKNPDGDPRGDWRAQDLSASKPYSAGIFTITGPTGREFNPPPNRYWRCSRDQFEKWVADGRIWWGVNNDARPMLKAFLAESDGGVTPHTWWDYSFAGHNKEATLQLKALFDGDAPFDTPKPIKLMRCVVDLFCGADDLVLDYFAGSAPMAEAVLRRNHETGSRNKFIMVQLPESTEREDYKSIADIARERIRRVCREVANDESSRGGGDGGQVEKYSPGFKAFNLASSNLKPWSPKEDDVAGSLFDTVDNIRVDREVDDLLYELLLKYGLDLTVSIEEREVAGKAIHVVGAGALVVCLIDQVGLDVVKGIASLKEELAPEVMRVIFKDSGFAGDVVKTNAVQILRQAGVDDVKTL